MVAAIILPPLGAAAAIVLSMSAGGPAAPASTEIREEGVAIALATEEQAIAAVRARTGQKLALPARRPGKQFALVSVDSTLALPGQPRYSLELLDASPSPPLRLRVSCCSLDANPVAIAQLPEIRIGLRGAALRWSDSHRVDGSFEHSYIVVFEGRTYLFFLAGQGAEPAQLDVIAFIRAFLVNT